MQGEASKRVTAWGLNGGPYGRYFPGMPMASAAAGAAPMAVEDSAASGQATAPVAPDFSGTNNQEVGVDEGDIVETDGTHVFVASQDGVRIVDVASAQVLAKLDVPQGTQQLLLDGTRLLVATQPFTGRRHCRVAVRRHRCIGAVPATAQPPRGLPHGDSIDRWHGATGGHDVAGDPTAVRPSRPVRARRRASAATQQG